MNRLQLFIRNIFYNIKYAKYIQNIFKRYSKYLYEGYIKTYKQNVYEIYFIIYFNY